MKRNHPNAEDHGGQGQAGVKKAKPDGLVRDALATLQPFTVLPLTRFTKAMPYCPRPTEIGCFSLDDKRKFHQDRSGLRHFVHPMDEITEQTSGEDGERTRDEEQPLNFDLTDGYERLISRDETFKENLDDILRWIQAAGKDGTGEKMDFVCWRGLLTKLCVHPYENRDEWRFVVGRFKGSLYLCEMETEAKVQQKMQESARSKEMCYWGVKFEQYVTAAKPDEEPDTQRPVNTNEAFVSVVRSQVGSHSLVFGGEVDCCSLSDPTKYLELKTSRVLDSVNQERNFKKWKMVKWWAQSFLIGIEDIICGFRDDNGQVVRLKSFTTSKIPNYCADTVKPWNSEVCLNFLNEFLAHIKTLVVKDHDKALYVFTGLPYKGIQCQVVAPNSEFKFLPQWYTDEPGAASRAFTSAKGFVTAAMNKISGNSH